jgi:hypothetical protein
MRCSLRSILITTAALVAVGACTTKPPPAAEPSAGAAGSPTMKVRDTTLIPAGDLKSDKSTGDANGEAKGNGASASEIADGSDDDIVARRLRKAAEQETDPELKDKLWKEYVECKKNAQPVAAR